MRWMIQRLGGKRRPATLLAGILAFSGLIPVFALAQEVRLPAPGEVRLVADQFLPAQPRQRAVEVSGKPVSPATKSEEPTEGAEPQRPKPQPGPQTPSQPQPQPKPQGQTAQPIEPKREASRTQGSRSQIPARGWLTPSDWELLARAVYAEARGESLEGQVAVAAVILNRRDDPRFPDRIANIIYEPGAFEAVTDGQINLRPDETAYRAVALALKGWDPSNGALYYWNPARSSSRWIWSRPVIRVIGQHWFAR